MIQRFLFLLKTYALTVLFFLLAKVAFFVCNAAGHDASVGDVPGVLAHGLTLDLSTALYVLSVPLLCAWASVYAGWPKWLRWMLHIWFLAVSLALSLAFVADTSLYPFWQFKLDASCLQYLDTPADAMASVSTAYLIVRLALIILLTVVFFLSYTRPRLNLKAGRRRWAETVAMLVFVPLFIIGIRGGIGESTTNIGQVYFSQNQFLNHAAVNPVFSFLSSFESTAREVTEYPFYTSEELARHTADLYPRSGISRDTLLTTQRPNVVIILMESCGKMFLDVMPHLRRAAGEGVDFTNCYGNSYRTDRGTLSTLSGYLSFPTMSVMKMSDKVEHLPAIARSLQHEGYTTEYLYGGDINFTKMRGYLISTGFQTLCWQQDFPPDEQNTAKWGVRDDITFQTLSQMILSHRDSRPFFIGYSTLSSHEPWDVPLNKYVDKEHNGFAYLDQCIGAFLDEMQRSPAWDHLLIIFVPDHSIDFREFTEQHPDRNRIPMIWTGGAVRAPQQIDRICNQSDLAATLLGQMGLDHSDFLFSRDITADSYRYPFAVHMFNNGISMTDSTGFMLYDLTAERITAGTSPDADRMAATAKAVLQLAAEDLSKK
ncbi:MAG: sulfatase-like hydrolase/transferase [Bacteroidaceae bacterium]|nr:sulfatase-like hydrolase/transferase [Bacteroidaceae bacterium]